MVSIDAAYDGLFCEGDADGCAQLPCGEAAECVDNPAPMVGVTCMCPKGFNITEDGSKCVGMCIDFARCGMASCHFS